MIINDSFVLHKYIKILVFLETTQEILQVLLTESVNCAIKHVRDYHSAIHSLYF